jgi:hypothetical protein
LEHVTFGFVVRVQECGMLLCLVHSMMRVGLVGLLLGVVVPIAMLVWVTLGVCVLHVDYYYKNKK